MLQRVLSKMSKVAKCVLPNNFTYNRLKKEFIFSRAVDVQHFIYLSLEANIKFKYLQEELKGKSNFVRDQEKEKNNKSKP